jgi:hypothetical protein
MVTAWRKRRRRRGRRRKRRRIRIRGVTLKSKAHVKSVMGDRVFQIDTGGLDYLLLKLKTANP